MASIQQITGGWIMIAVYASAILFFVIRGALRTRNMSDYAVGNFNFSPLFVGLSLAASMTSAATFVINPGLIAAYGLSGVLSFGIVFPIASLISLVILTKSFRRHGTNVKALTLASWIGTRYNSKGYALFIGFLSALLITFIVLILVAITKVLSQALNINEIWVLFFVVTFVFGYMMFGGANSMVYTNALQAIVMVIVAIILISSGYPYLKDGLFSFFDKLAAINPELIKPTNPSSPLFRDFFEIIVAQMIVGVAVVCQPHIITKSLLLKKESDVNKYLVSAIVIQILFYSVILTGLYARLTFPDMTAGGKPIGIDGFIPAYVVKVFSQGWVAISIGLIVVLGLVSAGLSTIEGLIQSLSTTVTSDIIKPLFGKHIANDGKYILINRLVIVGMAIVSFLAARSQLIHPNLSVAIFAQNGVYSFFSIAFIPIVFGIFYKNTSRNTALTGSITALVVYFVVYYILPWIITTAGISLGLFDKYFSGKVQNPAIAAASAIFVSVLVSLASYYYFRKSNSKRVNLSKNIAQP
jgi:sodium/pantothenate symporter